MCPEGWRGSVKCVRVKLLSGCGFKWPMSTEDLLVGKSAHSSLSQSMRLAPLAARQDAPYHFFSMLLLFQLTLEKPEDKGI